MGNLSEIDVLKAVDEALSELENPEARNRVLDWAWKKYSTKLGPSDIVDTETAVRSTVTNKYKKKGSRAKGKTKGKVKIKSSLSMMKDLNLKPKGKQSLDEFVDIKKPFSHYEKCAVSTYYLKHELDLSAISESHVYTCLKHMKWRIPANLSNTLAYTSSHYGWLDTSNLQDIKITTMGENLVEHDLPKQKGTKKK